MNFAGIWNGNETDPNVMKRLWSVRLGAICASGNLIHRSEKVVKVASLIDFGMEPRKSEAGGHVEQSRNQSTIGKFYSV